MEVLHWRIKARNAETNLRIYAPPPKKKIWMPQTRGAYYRMNDPLEACTSAVPHPPPLAQGLGSEASPGELGCFPSFPRTPAQTLAYSSHRRTLGWNKLPVKMNSLQASQYLTLRSCLSEFLSSGRGCFSLEVNQTQAQDQLSVRRSK